MWSPLRGERWARRRREALLRQGLSASKANDIVAREQRERFRCFSQDNLAAAPSNDVS